LNQRGTTHYYTLGGFRRVIYQKLCPNHAFLESCAHLYLGKLKIDHEKFIEDPNKIIEVIEECFEERNRICSKPGSHCSQTDEDEESKSTFGKGDNPTFITKPFQDRSKYNDI
jgi:hypothetical protein